MTSRQDLLTCRPPNGRAHFRKALPMASTLSRNLPSTIETAQSALRTSYVGANPELTFIDYQSRCRGPPCDGPDVVPQAGYYLLDQAFT